MSDISQAIFLFNPQAVDKLNKKQPTIQDVAAKAEVSTATVSRVLTAPESVSNAKRHAVQQAIHSTGYRVNRSARNLRTQRSNTVLALLPDLGNPFFSQVLQGIESVLTPAGQALLVAETNQIQESGDSLVNYLEDKRADGVIVLDGELPSQVLDSLANAEDERRLVFACEWIDNSNFPSVRSSNHEGAAIAVKHLHALGHEHIAHITGPKNNVLTAERLDGFLTTCKKLGIQHTVFAGAFTLEAGAAAAKELLSLKTKPSALFCASDTIAFGLISALTKHGLSIPEDISVMGYDDIDLCKYFVPPISSIRQDRVALGTQAAKLLLHCIENGPQPNKVERLPVSLVERESCAPQLSRTNS